MKYLKLFETYSPNHFWTELDQSGWSDLISSHKDIHFTKKEVEEIQKLCVELAPDSTTALRPNGWDVTIDYYDQIHLIHFFVHDISYVTIYKLEDEWFGICESWGMDGEAFYKCDQWLGLIETLKHIFEHA